MQLAASADGIVRFVPDLVRDGLVYSLKQAGMDTSAYETVIAGEKKMHADFFNAYAALNTKSLAREEYVYQVKNDLNIRTSVFDLPSFSRSVGEMIPQALPQLALAVATDGMSLGAQVAINASVGAGMAGGQAYARTGSHIKATEEAFWGGINGGMIPLGAKLNLIEDVSMQIGATVLQGKIRGVPDNEIIDQMMKQAGGAIAFRAGTKLNEGLAKLRGKESVSIDEAKHILFEETQTALRKGNVEYSEALQKFADEGGAKISIEGGKLKVETPLSTARNVQPKDTFENPTFKTGWSKDKVAGIPKGKRPNPSEYLDKSYIDNHLKKFEDGAAYLTLKEDLDSRTRDIIGRPDGQFIMPKSELDALLKRANGDISIIEKEIGITPGRWHGKQLVRIDIPNAKSLGLRMPTGNENGANPLWLPGGQLPTGKSEAVINQIAKGNYIETSVVIKK